jgi:D-mannonate dehydratase
MLENWQRVCLREIAFCRSKGVNSEDHVVATIQTFHPKISRAHNVREFVRRIQRRFLLARHHA